MVVLKWAWTKTKLHICHLMALFAQKCGTMSINLSTVLDGSKFITHSHTRQQFRLSNQPHGFLFVCFLGFFFRDRGGNQARKEHAETAAGIKPKMALWDGCANRCTIRSYSANCKKYLQLIIFNKMGMMSSSVCQLGSWVRVGHRAPQHCVLNTVCPCSNIHLINSPSLTTHKW